MSEDDVFGDYDYDDDVSLDPEDKHHAANDRMEWFKGKKGFTYRAAIVYFHPVDATARKAAKKADPKVDRETLVKISKEALAKRAEERNKAVDQLAAHEKLDTRRIQFRKFFAHYKEGVGYVVSRKGKDGKEADKVWDMMGEPRKYFTTILLVYPTTKEGEIDKDQLSKGWEVKPWRFSGKVYGRLHQVAAGLRSNELAIATQDLSLKCTNDEYQNFEIDGAGRGVWLKSDKFRDKVLEAAAALYKELNPFRELSTADLKMKLGIGGEAGEDVSDDDFDDILDQV